MGFQAEIVPSSVAKMKAAANFEPGTKNAVVGLERIPVGEEIDPAGAFFGGAIVTTNETRLPSPLNRFDVPE